MNSALQNSVDYLLKKAGKNSGYNVPTSYFESFEEQLYLNVSEASFPKKHGYATPNNYFTSLENTTLKKITKPQKRGRRIELKKKLLTYSTLATAACLLLFFSFYNAINTNSLHIDSLADTEIESWLENNLQDFSIAYEDIDIDETSFLLTTIEDSALEEYLNTTETIINELY